MTDEEMAGEYAGNISGLDINTTIMVAENKTDAYRLGIYEGFLAGLRVSKSPWHDLRKDPNDLPKKNGEYFCKVNSHWEKYGVKHFTLQPYGYNRQWEGQGYSVIAWCEIPTFDKE